MKGNTSRFVALGALAVALVVAVIAFTGGSSHTLKITVPAADDIVKGAPLSAGGKNIGAVSDIEPLDRGHRAQLTVSVTDDKYWPLPTDSTIGLRQGGTISFSNRYLLLHLGTSSSTYGDGDTIPENKVSVPVETDQLINAVNPKVQAGMKAFWDQGGPSMKNLSTPLHEALPKAPPAAKGADSVFKQLTSDRAALSSLIVSSDNVTKAINAANPDLRTLLSGAATTFDAIGSRASELQLGLQRLPEAMDHIQTFLQKANPAVQNVDRVTRAIAPAIPEVEKTAPLLTTALQGLGRTLPLGTEALRHSDGADFVSDTFIEGTKLAPRLTSLAAEANKAVNCIRPYSPEIAALGGIWGDFISEVDDRDHVVHAQVQNYLPAGANVIPYGPAQAKQLFPGLTYGFPRPPGNLADQNWFLPKCGAGPDAINPAKDQEYARYKANLDATTGGGSTK